MYTKIILHNSLFIHHTKIIQPFMALFHLSALFKTKE